MFVVVSNYKIKKIKKVYETTDTLSADTKKVHTFSFQWLDDLRAKLL